MSSSRFDRNSKEKSTTFLEKWKENNFLFLLIWAQAEEFRFTQCLTVNVFHLRFLLARVFKACDKFLSLCSESFRMRNRACFLKSRAAKREKEKTQIGTRLSPSSKWSEKFVFTSSGAALNSIEWKRNLNRNQTQSTAKRYHVTGCAFLIK